MEAIWPGSGSAVSGNTPFGLYDTDSTFQSWPLKCKIHNFTLVWKNQ